MIGDRHRIVTDEPEHLGGEDVGPAPHELFPAALASCVSTTLQMVARTRGWRLDAVDVEVLYDHRSTPRRFEIAIRVDGDLTAEQLARLERAAAACPVRRAVESGVVFEETFEHASRASHASTA